MTDVIQVRQGPCAQAGREVLGGEARRALGGERGVRGGSGAVETWESIGHPSQAPLQIRKNKNI